MGLMTARVVAVAVALGALAACTKGDQGDPGPEGPPGATGPVGPQGAAGADGRGTAVLTSSEQAGTNCPTGGARVDFGIDANANGALDPGEVNAALTRYVCNGAQGPQGPQGQTGATGAPGAAGATGPQGPAGILAAYGDGSANALAISSPTDWTTAYPGANLQFTTFTVTAGGSLIVPSGTTIRVTGNAVIDGTVIVDQGAADNGQFRPLAGVSLGAASQGQGGLGLTQLSAARLVKIPVLGGGAGARNAVSTGGEGGGSFAIYAQGTISVGGSGQIQARGANAVNPNTAGQGITGSGGGAGGLVVLIGKAGVSVAGVISVAGGNGSGGFDGNGGSAEGGGGGGGGGIVHLLSTVNPTVSGSVVVGAGNPGATAGTGATINAGGGGGACGGNGGLGASTGVSATGGTAGYLLQSRLPTPEALLL